MKEQKKKEEKIEWDKRKIIIFLFLILLFMVAGYELKTFILGQDANFKNTPLLKTDVKGDQTSNIPLQSNNIKQSVQNEINNLKNEAQNINLVDIASSSPQVQKVINDLKAIQNYPSTQLKETCEKICSGL